tara:strand:+ start:73 stop:711 length:639 start_codon:yes stop_codon:yes gene_type:complete
MAFKLPSEKVNPLKSKGLLNKSPFKANGNTMAYNNGDPTTSKPVDKSKLEKTAKQIVAGGAYDADAVKANKEQRTKEFNETPEGRALADKVNKLSGAMGSQKAQSRGINKGKFSYQDISKDPGYQTVYFSPDDYKSAADEYAKAKFEFSRPINEAMKEKLGNVKTYTDTERGEVVDYGEYYGNAGEDRFSNVGRAKVEVDRPNPSNNIVNKD